MTSASLRSRCSVSPFGTARHRSPAAFAARTPLGESSIAIASAGSTPRQQALLRDLLVIAAADALAHSLPVRQLADQALQVKDGVEVVGRADDAREVLDLQLVAVLAEELCPALEERRFGVDDQAVEVEDRRFELVAQKSWT